MYPLETALVKLEENPYLLPGGFAPRGVVAPKIHEFKVVKLIDKLQIWVVGYHFNAIKALMDECFQYSHATKEKSFLSHTWKHGETDISLYSWRSKFGVTILATSVTEEVQAILLSHVLVGLRRTLGQIEFAVDFYNQNPTSLIALRAYLEDGLVLKDARGFGFNYDKCSSYYGTNGYSRNHQIEGKRMSRSKGLAIYFKDHGDGNTVLRFELRLNSKGIESRLRQHRKFEYIIRPDELNPFDFARYVTVNLNPIASVVSERKGKSLRWTTASVRHFISSPLYFNPWTGRVSAANVRHIIAKRWKLKSGQTSKLLIDTDKIQDVLRGVSTGNFHLQLY